MAQAERAAANGSCRQGLRGAMPIFVAQVVPEMLPEKSGLCSGSREVQTVARPLKGFMGRRCQKLDPHGNEKRSFGPAFKDSALLLALLK